MNTRILAPLVLVLAGCSTDVVVGDSPGRVVAVGPVWLDGDRLVVEYATWDAEGDAIRVAAEVVNGDATAALSAAALAPYSLDSVPTAPGVETQHVFEWAFASDGIEAGAAITLRLGTGDPAVPSVEFGPFVPGELVPADPLPPAATDTAP